MKNGIRRWISAVLIGALSVPSFAEAPLEAEAASGSDIKIHFLNLSDEPNDAILLECNGHFGMIDAGEDNDYPDGSDPRYPLREGTTVGEGHEDEVISYLHSAGVRELDFFIGTHPHSDHIGAADEIIREFTPDRVYLMEYDDAYISSEANLWDNQYVYDRTVAAAKEVGASLIQNFDPDAPLYPERVSVSGLITWDDSNDADGIRPSQLEVRLFQTVNGHKEQIDALTVTPDDVGTWYYQFDSLPQKTDDGDTITYSVEADIPEGYEQIINPDTFKITYTHEAQNTPEEAKDRITGTILWEDNDNAEYLRPGQLELTLYQRQTASTPGTSPDSPTPSGGIAIQTIEVQANERGLWKYEFTGLDETIPLTDENYYLELSDPGSHYMVTYDSLHQITCTYYSDTSKPTGLQSDPSLYADTFSLNLAPSVSIAPEDQVDPTHQDDRTNPDTLPDSGTAAANLNAMRSSGELSDKPDANSVGNPVFTLGDDMTIEIMNYYDDYKTHPKPDANYFCLGVKVTANGHSAFFGGDINNYEGAETRIADQVGHVDLLKLNHHGSYGSNTPGFLSTLSADYIVMCGDMEDMADSTLRTILYDLGSPKFYATQQYDAFIDATVFDFSGSGITSNVPSDAMFCAVTRLGPLFIQDGSPYFWEGWLDYDGKRYYMQDGLLPVSNGWVTDTSGKYYMNAQGQPVTGWNLIDGTQYYFSEDEATLGQMQTGWVERDGSRYYFLKSGDMATGVQSIDGEEYYFLPDGTMGTNIWNNMRFYGEDGTYVPDYVNENWEEDKNGWKMKGEDGKYLTDQWYFLEGQWYLFSKQGYRLDGWQKVGAAWYHLNEIGQMDIGWSEIDGNWYYFNEIGQMQTGWREIDGTWYYLNSAGQRVIGWQLLDGAYYFFNAEGKMLTGWFYQGGYWYYTDPDGKMAAGWRFINNNWYFLNASGHMVSGWLQLGSFKYYLNASGAMTTGWQTIGNQFYYFSESGIMQTGWRDIDGKRYYLAPEDGHLWFGWLTLSDGSRYYCSADGSLTYGWLGPYYLAPEDGHMVTGDYVIDGVTYRFGSDGILIGTV